MKNLLIFCQLLLIIIFFYFVFNIYISKENTKKVHINRSTVNINLKNYASELIILKSDTDNIIEYNSGYNFNSKNIKKRNFWDLIKNEK